MRTQKYASLWRRESSGAPTLLPSARNPDFSGIIERVASAADLGAAPCVRLQARQRRPRHARDPGLSRPSQYPEHDALYRLGAASVQGILSRLIHAACRSSAACCCASCIISIDLARETALTICPDNSRERTSGRRQQGPFCGLPRGTPSVSACFGATWPAGRSSAP